MVLHKRLDYGFNGYQVPPTPRAARSARRRGINGRITDDGHMCAFDLLATLAGKLLLEGESSPSSTDMCSGKEQYESIKDSFKEGKQQENKHVSNFCNQSSSDRSFIVSELVLQAPRFTNCLKELAHTQNDASSGPTSAITTSECSEKVVSAKHLTNDESKVGNGSFTGKADIELFGCRVSPGCKLDGESNRQIKVEPNDLRLSICARNDKSNSECQMACDRKPLCLVSSDNSVKSLSRDYITSDSLPFNRENVKLVSRDDDENSSGCTQPSTTNKAFRPSSRIGDRRIRKLLASKYWKVTPNLKDGKHFKSDADIKNVYHNGKNDFKQQRSQRDYPFKKRKLYHCSSLSNSDGGNCTDGMCKSPGKGSSGDPSASMLPRVSGTLTSEASEHASFRSKDAHVKLKIKSFRVPEFFIEIPETATVGSLKKTVMEAVTAILSGGLRVGVLLQGKKIRDDNKTLLQTGICHDNKLDALGFTLEPNLSQAPPPLSPEDHPFLLPCDGPQPLSRYPPAPSTVNTAVFRGTSDTLPDLPGGNLSNFIESDHDSAPSPPDISLEKSTVDSRALVTAPAMDVEALSVVPMRKSKRSEAAQRRIRRPFSVSEVEALVQAVEKLGTGRWRDVKLRAFDNAKHRTYVDLKDKWKTLVHTARISPQQRRGEPVPQELLDRVLTAHAYWSQQQVKPQFKQQSETCRLA
ncbi:hypothetical protein ACH5RR_010087 [Cinchona calisaya]|uniref:Telomere repeat-binding protein 5 n=1 Tax=Cinchona calisaya TaxID=153742 RepID=A0ABD3AFZ7_9GENT